MEEVKIKMYENKKVTTVGPETNNELSGGKGPEEEIKEAETKEE
jgi:hypothetical protein